MHGWIYGLRRPELGQWEQRYQGRDRCKRNWTSKTEGLGVNTTGGGKEREEYRDSQGSSSLRTQRREHFWGGEPPRRRQVEAEAGCPAHETTQRSILRGKHWRREMGQRGSSGSLRPRAADGRGVMCWGGLGQRWGGLMFEGGQKRRPRGRQRRRAKHVMGKPGGSDDMEDSR